MAVHKGSKGLVKIRGVTVAEVTSFTLNETSEVIETSNPKSAPAKTASAKRQTQQED